MSKKVIGLTLREQAILLCMFDAMKETVVDKRRACIPPAEIRDKLAVQFPGVKVFHITSSQKNLEKFELISRVVDPAKTRPISGKRAPLVFEFNEKLYVNSNIVTIEKRVGGYPIGIKKNPKDDPVDRAKSIISKAEKLVAETRKELEQALAENKKTKKKLENGEKNAEKLRTIVTTIDELLRLKNRNFKAWEKKIKRDKQG